MTPDDLDRLEPVVLEPAFDAVDSGSVAASDPFTPAAPTAPVRTTISASLAVVEFDPDLRDQLCAILGEGVAPFATIDEMADRLTGAVPVVAVLGPSCANEPTIDRTGSVVAQFPILGCVLVTHELTTAVLQHALRAGIRDVLSQSGGVGPLVESIQRISATLEQAVAAPAAPVVAAPAPPAEAPGAEEPAAGEIIAVFSPKGGSGTTVLATSLAVELASRSTRPVCIVDADLQFGDVAVSLKLTPHHTIVDAVAAGDRLDAAMLDSLLVTHEPTGLKVLPAPLEPAYADQVSAADLTRILEVLRSVCSFVIVDTPSYLNDVVLSVFDVADSITLVAGLDIPSIKNVKVTLQTLRLLNLPEEKLLLALNRADSKVKLDVAEVERALQFRAEVQIPSDVCVPQAVNKGEPVIRYAPKSGVTKAITAMADRYAAPLHNKRKK
ncbi:MAG: AAA family ATPase [Microthrixaceae bacterium]